MSEKQAKRRLAFQKSYSIEKSEPIRRRSLIEDAKFDKITNLSLQILAEQNRVRLSSEASISEDEESEYSDEEDAGLPEWACIVQPKTGHSAQLSSIMYIFEKHNVHINHIESRPVTDCDTVYESRPPVTDCDTVYGSRPIEVLVKFNISHDQQIQSIQNDIKNNIELNKTVVTKFQCLTPTAREAVWIPVHITDLDRCTHLITKFEPDLDQGHPGFDDLSYRKRRQTIANIAFNYKQNDSIPDVEYVAEEVKAWKDTYLKLQGMTKTMGSQIYLDNLKLLENEGVYSCEFIPQLNSVSTFLKRRSGFTLRPAAGLLSARDFLASLAFRVFQCTQYVRHYSRPDHSPEPDCIHELMGHIPMFADPDFAQFSQEIGILSLGACDEDIEKLATLYWFTVEFGLCKEDGVIKAYGAGLLSSYGELEHALSGKPELRSFEPATTSIQPYQDDDFQSVYFVTESFDDMKEKVRMFAQSIVKPYELRYDPYTSSVQILDNDKAIHEVIEVVKDELNHLYTVLHKLRKNKKRSSIERKTPPKLSNGVS